MTSWIREWTDTRLQHQIKYIVCPINQRQLNGHSELYLGQPIGILYGWEVARLRQGCYAALVCPPLEIN